MINLPEKLVTLTKSSDHEVTLEQTLFSLLQKFKNTRHSFDYFSIHYLNMNSTFLLDVINGKCIIHKSLIIKMGKLLDAPLLNLFRKNGVKIDDAPVVNFKHNINGKDNFKTITTGNIVEIFECPGKYKILEIQRLQKNNWVPRLFVLRCDVKPKKVIKIFSKDIIGVC